MTASFAAKKTMLSHSMQSIQGRPIMMNPTPARQESAPVHIVPRGSLLEVRGPRPTRPVSSRAAAAAAAAPGHGCGQHKRGGGKQGCCAKGAPRAAHVEPKLRS